jgi:hypothetical protein
MKDSNFLIGLRFYLIVLHYSIFVAYVYGNYKNYNINESILIGTSIGILSPFFVPFHYIIQYLYKKERPIIYQNSHIEIVPIIIFDNLKYKYNINRPIKIRV